ncbi:hypothetical protein NEUTE1DRAFT_104474 [Neurospora tetrasperma FGSC 2508]|uniref:Heterokaryon incompatibility domain-containing protein n=1 Tax=Neurospora tetrasperma (strain FGSC 2508 / ATCC MYA-4615 / P0657) TaxID=510951 RepID=F8MYN3_NEUT8|nr:uncharacterized protein NEUTE1DRAFT_104474 [Neurospora tetrasperma FGSC 2508]EGO51430.1 hypothetical protein NEUTE1DRAFT_104474 [Neurospora tetrasperma FGSC 2508]
MSTRLCAVCNGIFTGLLVDKSYMPHHQSVASLRRSAEEGCYICNLVSAMLEFDKVSDDEGPFRWTLYTNSEERRHHFQQYKTYGSLDIEAKNATYVLNLMDQAVSNAPIRSVDPGASLTDQAVIGTARSWLENCRQNHASCEPVDPAFNPTRLLYIHDASSVQLIETEKEAKTHAYVAFSHCWGNYDDWAKESAMMKDVYANSSLNLCASAAGDSSEASFQHRDRGIIVPLEIEPHWTGYLHGNTWEKRKLGPLPSYLHRIKFKLVNSNMNNSEITNSPLNLRAWVVQERVLSRRHLFMTCNQLWWECPDMFACEVFPGMFPDFEYIEDARVQYYALNGPGHHSVYGSRMERLWESLVMRYSRCDLTYLYDKLPALSGLAQIFSVARGPDFSLDLNSYLAGIWRPHLPKALCWYTKSNEKSGQIRRYRPHPYRAPSWSWASVEGPVEVKGSREPVCRVVDVKVVREDEQYKAGTVKGGILHLESHLIGPLTHDGSHSGGFTTTTPLDSRLRATFNTMLFQTYWDEGDGDSRDQFISYLDPLPHTVSENGIVKGTSAVRKRVLLKDLVRQRCIRLFIIPLLVDHSMGQFTGLILCQIVRNPGLEGVDEGAVFQRVGYFIYHEIKWGTLDLIPKDRNFSNQKLPRRTEQNT